MRQLETHKCALLQQLFLFSTWTDVTNPGGMLCSPYQLFVVVLK